MTHLIQTQPSFFESLLGEREGRDENGKCLVYGKKGGGFLFSGGGEEEMGNGWEKGGEKGDKGGMEIGAISFAAKQSRGANKMMMEEPLYFILIVDFCCGNVRMNDSHLLFFPFFCSIYIRRKGSVKWVGERVGFGLNYDGPISRSVFGRMDLSLDSDPNIIK